MFELTIVNNPHSMLKKCLFLFLLITFYLSNSILCAQTSEVIRTGRPGQSIGPHTVGEGYFQLQTGATRYFDTGETYEISSWTNQTIFRYGVSEHVELSALMGYNTFTLETPLSSLTNSTLNPIYIGGRINLLDQTFRRFKLGLQSRINIFDGDKFTSTDLASVLVGTFHINPKTSLVANLISNLDWNFSNSLGYTLSLNRSLGNQFGCFIEAYGDLASTPIKVDGGLAFILTNNLQFDVSAGWESGFEQGRQSYFGDLGVSWRFAAKR